MAVHTLLTLTLLSLCQASVPNGAASTTSGASIGTGIPTGLPSPNDPAPGLGLGKLKYCLPTTGNSSQPDTSAPCYVTFQTSTNCTEIAKGNATASQQCYCAPDGAGIAYWENAQGCSDCERLHGISDPADYIPAQAFSPFSSSYCAVATPTAVFASYLSAYTATALSSLSIGTATPTDVLGTSTAVSDYFTATPVGSAATASAATGSAASGSGSSSSSGAAPTMGVGGMGAGLVGILGVAVLL